MHKNISFPFLLVFKLQVTFYVLMHFLVWKFLTLFSFELVFHMEFSKSSLLHLHFEHSGMARCGGALTSDKHEMLGGNKFGASKTVFVCGSTLCREDLPKMVPPAMLCPAHARRFKGY